LEVLDVSVDRADVIDVVSIDKSSSEVILTISDHLDWSDSSEHQRTLQAKFNAYLAFVESGEVFQRYPSARGRPVVFNVVFKFGPDKGGREFLNRAREVIRGAGFELRHELFASSYDN
jgi:hypothetical protein